MFVSFMVPNTIGLSINRFFLGSAALHLLLCVLCFWGLPHLSPRNLDQKNWTYVELEPVPRAAPPELTKKTAKSDEQRVVQTDAARLVEKAADDAFFGERNQVADRQSMSLRQQGAQAQAQRSPEKSKSRETARIALKDLGALAIPAFKPNAPRVTPDKDDARWAAQANNSAQDYVKGVQESDRTLLNTKEYVFYGYFQRIRQRLDQAWVPILREKLTAFWYRGRSLASDMDHTTKVLVVMNGQGEIVKVQLMGESGTRDLDDAAVQAFNAAGPFPNPPKGIVDTDGNVKISWEFVLKT